MDRQQFLTRRLHPAMKLLEIGPSHRPVVAKRHGWNTTVVDHADRDSLIEKYRPQGVDIEAIEAVDVVWNGEALHGLVDCSDRRYDAIVASHVLEHIPDPLSFLDSAAAMLTDSGIIVLALPDRRYMFDFFQQPTTTADWLVAYDQKRVTHSRKIAFEHVAYNVTQAGRITWNHGEVLRDLRLTTDVRDADRHFHGNVHDGHGNHYHDYHAWHFTPSSFMLIMVETALLRDIPFVVVECTPAAEYEFFVVLGKGRPPARSDEEVNQLRLRLMKAAVMEARHGTDLLLGVL